jgi:hypothetical protein
MKQEIVAQSQTTAVATTTQTAPMMDTRDIILPSLAIRQNSYKKEYMKKLRPGDVIKRPQDQVIASEDKSCLFCPVGIEKLYRVMVVTPTETKTIRYEPY